MQQGPNNNNNLINDILHETHHKNNNLEQNLEEKLAQDYQQDTANLINFYHNQGNYSDNPLSQFISWGYANSSSSDQYLASNNYVNNFYQISTINVNPVNLVTNNYQVANIGMVRGEVLEALTIFVHGTNSSPKEADPEFIKVIGDTFGEKVLQHDWSPGKNTKEARLMAAKELKDKIIKHQFTEDEKLNIIDHSHGGNVVKEFTQLYDGNKKIDTLVFLGTPHRDDYQLDYSDLTLNSNLINIYDRGDWLVQPILGSGLSGSIANQTLPRALNISIRQTETINHLNWKNGQIYNTQVGAGWLDSHSNLDSKPVWDLYVKPNLKK